MDATIAEILSLSELKECRLLNPGVSLSQPVKSVTIMDNPEIFNWMSDYEILFSNGASLTSLNSMEWKAFFEGLSKKRSAGLFIKLQYYVDSIPEDAVEHAKRLDLPIVVVPNCYSWVRLSTPIQQYIIKEQFYLVNEALKLGDALNDAMVRGENSHRYAMWRVATSAAVSLYSRAMDGTCSEGRPLWIGIRCRAFSRGRRADSQVFPAPLFFATSKVLARSFASIKGRAGITPSTGALSRRSFP